MRLRKAASLPECGVAVTRIRCRFRSAARSPHEPVALGAAGPALRRRLTHSVGLVDDHEVRARRAGTRRGDGRLLMKSVDTTVTGSARRATRPGARPRSRRRDGRRQGRARHRGGTCSLISALPLLGEVRRAEDGEPLALAAVQELRGDEAGLDRLADADVVGDEEPDGVLPQRHEQRHELVGPRARPRYRAKRAERAARWTGSRGAARRGAGAPSAMVAQVAASAGRERGPARSSSTPASDAG